MGKWEVGLKPCECGHAKSKHSYGKGRCLEWVACIRDADGNINEEVAVHCTCECYIDSTETRILPRLRALPL